MVAKTVNLTNRDYTFKTQGQAQTYYYDLIKRLHKNDDFLSEGQDFEDLKEIYLLYCQYTNYKLSNKNIDSFKGVRNIEKHNTICAQVIFDDSTSEMFSTNKAIKEIADYQN